MVIIFIPYHKKFVILPDTPKCAGRITVFLIFLIQQL